MALGTTYPFLTDKLLKRFSVLKGAKSIKDELGKKGFIIIYVRETCQV